MYRKLSVSLLAICVISWSMSALSIEVLTEQYDIVGLIPSDSGVYIQLDPNPTRCTASWWGTQAVIKTTAGNYNALVAGITSAMMANKKISVIHYNALGNGDCSNSNELDVIAYKIIK